VEARMAKGVAKWQKKTAWLNATVVTRDEQFWKLFSFFDTV